MAAKKLGPHFSGPVKLGAASMPLSTDIYGLSTATTLTADESNGMHYILDGGTGFVITLPVATQGWRCKFTIGAVFSTDFTFTAGTADSLEGCILEAGAVQDITNGDGITLEDDAENVGDFIEFWSDGTSTFVFGNFLNATSVTEVDP